MWHPEAVRTGGGSDVGRTDRVPRRGAASYRGAALCFSGARHRDRVPAQGKAEPGTHVRPGGSPDQRLGSDERTIAGTERTVHDITTSTKRDTATARTPQRCARCGFHPASPGSAAIARGTATTPTTRRPTTRGPTTRGPTTRGSRPPEGTAQTGTGCRRGVCRCHVESRLGFHGPFGHWRRRREARLARQGPLLHEPPRRLGTDEGRAKRERHDQPDPSRRAR